MIDRFNFYDVFGYLIPGTLTVAAFWLPFGVLGSWPSTDLASAVVVIVIAYVIGHFLQAIGTRAIPSTTSGRLRSSALLDRNNPGLPDRLKEEIDRLGTSKFGLQLQAADASAAAAKAADGARAFLFQIAREQLLAAERARYAEQFQALYAMMRGNMLAACLGVAFATGWLLSAPSVKQWAFLSSAALSIVWLLLLARSAILGPSRKGEQVDGFRELLVLLALVVAIGLVSGAKLAPHPNHREILLAAIVAFIALAFQCWRSYERFADEFAKAVYRGFVQVNSLPAPKADK